MAAPLGFKTFNSGDVLTAADTNGYLMQGVWTFANAAARTAAVTSPQEGNVSFLKDTNSFEIYDGAAWVAYGSGDITGVTAGTGISGGGTSGTVTVTNSMATEITAAGDIIVGTGSGTFDNLPIGTTGQVLTADTTVSPYKVKWAAAGSGFSGCSVYKSANQTINNGTGTNLTWDSEFFDTNSYHSTVTNTERLTVPNTGYYLLTGLISWQGNATSNRQMTFQKNGNDICYVYTTPNSSSNSTMNTIIVNATANDYFVLRCYQNSGSNLVVYGGQQDTIFSIVYLGA